MSSPSLWSPQGSPRTQRHSQTQKLIGSNFRKDIDILFSIGRGAFGDVYCAIHKPTGTLVAVKSRVATKPDELAEIKNEMKLLKTCNSEFVVRYLGSALERTTTAIGKVEMRVWIGMEFCEPGSLKQIIKTRSFSYPEVQPPSLGLTEAEIRSAARDVLKGLEYIHGRKMIHRDLKCDNILVARNGTAKLADLGVSAVVRGTMGRRSTMIGTPHFLAPEVVAVEDSPDGYDYRCDFWSLGITLIEMAEKDPPRFGEPAMRLLFSIPKTAPPRLAYTSLWSSDFADFLNLMLQLNPDDRAPLSTLLAHPFVVHQPEDRIDMAALAAAHIKYRAHATHTSRKREVLLGLEPSSSDKLDRAMRRPASEPVAPQRGLLRKVRVHRQLTAKEAERLRQRTMDISQLLAAADRLDGDDPAAARAVRELLELGKESVDLGSLELSASEGSRASSSLLRLSVDVGSSSEFSISTPRTNTNAESSKPALPEGTLPLQLPTKMERFARSQLKKGLAADLDENFTNATRHYQKACDVMLELLRNKEHQIEDSRRKKLAKTLKSTIERLEQLALPRLQEQRKALMGWGRGLVENRIKFVLESQGYSSEPQDQSDPAVVEKNLSMIRAVLRLVDLLKSRSPASGSTSGETDSFEMDSGVVLDELHDVRSVIHHKFDQFVEEADRYLTSVSPSDLQALAAQCQGLRDAATHFTLMKDKESAADPTESRFFNVVSVADMIELRLSTLALELEGQLTSLLRS